MQEFTTKHNLSKYFRSEKYQSTNHGCQWFEKLSRQVIESAEGR